MGIIQFREANCKNCYKCVRSCPVKAISFKDEQAQIIENECILCGKCLLVCPQNAKSVKSDIDKVKDFIDGKEKVYVSLAPSYAAAFGESNPLSILMALEKLGFTNIEETAIGAARVSIEYKKLLNEGRMTNIITTSCATIVFLIEKYYPDLIGQLAPVVSPMIAHAKMMKNMYGDRIKVVFIGPCISKKNECNDLQNEGLVDAVITFEELEKWLEEENIDITSLIPENQPRIKYPVARFYPAPGGIIKTLNLEGRRKYRYIAIDGIERCMEVLGSIRNGTLSNYFIEMNSCTGGCLGGPCMRHGKGGLLEAREKLIKYIKECPRESEPLVVEDAKVELDKVFVDRSRDNIIPSEEEMHEILRSIGKFKKEDELNCGACGYHSCREKAIAVYNRKAELYMCLPYMRERAESISNIVTNSTPNGILALNENLYIQEINPSAETLFNLKKEDVLGKHVFEVLDCYDFEYVRKTGRNIIDKKYIYEPYGVVAEQTILYIREHKVIIVLIKDITGEENYQRQMYKVRQDTVDTAQQVIEKQMRVAQEIASLLGETTAETKLALTKLKKSILSETGDTR